MLDTTKRIVYNDNVRRLSGALVPTINCQGKRNCGVSSSYRSSLLHSIRTRVHLFCSPLTNKYWMNTYFFSGGLAVRCVLWYLLQKHRFDFSNRCFCFWGLIRGFDFAGVSVYNETIKWNRQWSKITLVSNAWWKTDSYQQSDRLRNHLISQGRYTNIIHEMLTILTNAKAKKSNYVNTNKYNYIFLTQINLLSSMS